jgi:hypothetical protein
MKPCKFWNGNVKNFENKEELEGGNPSSFPWWKLSDLGFFFSPRNIYLNFFGGENFSIFENNIINVKTKKREHTPP